MFSKSSGSSSFCFINNAMVHKEAGSQEDHQLIRLKQLSVQEDDEEQNIIATTTKPVLCPPINLKLLEIPSSSSDHEGLKTPTSSEHKIPVIQDCPGAPKKTKSKAATKRKLAYCRPRIVVDLSKDLESLFPMAPYVVDLGGAVIMNNKRVKQCSAGTDF